MNVKVIGEPEPAVHWLKNDTELKADKRTEITNKGDGAWALTINSAIKNDAGQYKACVENSFGEASCEADVKIIPEIRYVYLLLF